MGGDAAPEIVVRGAGIARERFPDVRFLMYGGGEAVADLVAADAALAEQTELREAPTVISPEAKASQALRSGRDSSMWRALDAVKRGEAAAAVSAGNTGALMAISKFVLRMPVGVSRPALASIMPTATGENVTLDLGAHL